MRVVLAPDAFTGSMSATEAVEAMARGVLAVHPDAQVLRVPMADGGEGTVAAVVGGTADGRLVEVAARDALGRPVRARYGLLPPRPGLGRPTTAVVEVAAALGLDRLAPDERDALAASSAGAGDLLLHALRSVHAVPDQPAQPDQPDQPDQPAQPDQPDVVVGLGGTATTDGGVGLLEALGATFLAADGRPVTGRDAVDHVARIDLTGAASLLAGTRVLLACDVVNPLTGPSGSAAVFAPQKGADPAQVALLEARLERIGSALAAAAGRDVVHAPGAGAAGGLGAALLALGASMRRGVDVVAEAVGLREALRGADLVLTGEGSCDAQTAGGKTVHGVLRLAREERVPVLVLAGRVGQGAAAALGRAPGDVVAITPPGTPLAEALREGPAHLERAVTAVLTERLPGRRRPPGRHSPGAR